MLFPRFSMRGPVRRAIRKEEKMRLSILPAILALVLGCAAMQPAPVPAPDPIQDIKAALSGFHAAMKAEDAEGMLAWVSDDYSDGQGLNKAALRGYLASLIAQGIFSSMEVDIGNCKIVVDGGMASASPVVYTSYMDATPFKIEWKKEADGTWKMLSHNQIWQ